MTDCGYSAGGAEGENIAFGQTDANDVMNAWLNSPGHKANIEQPSFRSIGVGAADRRQRPDLLGAGLRAVE